MRFYRLGMFAARFTKNSSRFYVLENRNSFFFFLFFFSFNLFGRFAYHVVVYLRFDDYFSPTSVLSLFASLSFALIFAAFSFSKLKGSETRSQYIAPTRILNSRYDDRPHESSHPVFRLR